MPKKFAFISDAAKKEFMAFPNEVIDQFGHDLNLVQHSQSPVSNFKHLASTVGQGAIELIENGSPAYRSVYCAKFNDTVYLLHSFEKTTNGTDNKAMQTAKKRYEDMLEIVKRGT